MPRAVLTVSHRLAHLATRVFNTPLMLHPRKVDVIMAALAERFGVVSLDNFAPRPAAWVDTDNFEEEGTMQRGDYDIIEGVARIEISGTLVNKLGLLGGYSGLTGYDGIRQNFMVALDDPEVKGIVLDIDSPGGEVAGCFDLVDAIYAARGTKPVIAILNESAYSAAYALASAADYITVPRTGGAGSVGVIAMHVDLSKAIKNAGMKVTFVTYGARKKDGHPEIPLDPEAKAAWQTDVDTMGELFVSTVARNRGIDVQRVIDTQAGCYMGQKAVDIGFADKVCSPAEAFDAFLASVE